MAWTHWIPRVESIRAKKYKKSLSSALAVTAVMRHSRFLCKFDLILDENL